MAAGTPYTLATDVNATTTATTIAMTTTVKGNAGDRIIAEVAYRAATPSAISVADNSGGGNTWHLDKQQDGGNGSVAILSCVLAADLAIGTVITATGGSATRRWMRVHGISGTAAGNPDANHIGGANSSGTAPSAATAGTTPAAGDYVVATLSRYGAATSDTATAGGSPGTFVEKADIVIGSATPWMQAYSETQVLASGGTVTASPSWTSTTGGWEAVVVVYVVTSGTAYNLPIGHISSLAAVRGVESPMSGVQALGHVASPGVIRGLDMTDALIPTNIGKILSPGLVRGLGAPLAGAATIGHITSLAAVRGVSSTMAGGQALGHVPSPAAVRGLASPMTGSASLGHVKTPSRATAVCSIGHSDQALGGVLIPDVLNLLGVGSVGLRQNADIVANWTSTSAHTNQYNNGYTRTYRSIQLDAADGGFAAVIAGTHDAAILTMAANLAVGGKFSALNPALICFNHESSIWATAGTAQQGIDAYRHVRDLLDANGYTVYSKTGVYLGGHIEMAYVCWDRMFVGANGIGGPTAGQGVDDWDPDKGTSPAPAGTSYYEYLGTDLYNLVDSPGVLRYGTNAATLMQPVIDAAVARNKDIIIGELGCGDGTTTLDHTNKADWFNSLTTLLKNRGNTSPGVVRRIWLTVKASSENYNVDSSPQALAAMQSFVRDPYFADRRGPVVRGLDAPAAVALPIGHIPSLAAVRGLGAIIVYIVDLGHIPSSSAVRGVSQAATLTPTSIGHVSSLAAVRGLGTPVAFTLPIGHVSGIRAVRGLTTPLTAALPIGHIPSPAAVRGLGTPVAFTLPIGHIGSPRAVRGLGIIGTYTLAIGHIPGQRAVYGITIPSALGAGKATLSYIVPCYSGSVVEALFPPEVLVALGAFNSEVPSNQQISVGLAEYNTEEGL